MELGDYTKRKFIELSMEIFDIRMDFLNNPMDLIIYFQRITSNISTRKMERGYKEFPLLMCGTFNC